MEQNKLVDLPVSALARGWFVGCLDFDPDVLINSVHLLRLDNFSYLINDLVGESSKDKGQTLQIELVVRELRLYC